MRITKRQKEEIEFLCKHFGGKKEDAEEYLQATVHGVRVVSDKLSGNSLRIAKTKLDRNVKMWQEGLEEGTLSPLEMNDWFDDPFGTKVVRSVLASTGKENLSHFLRMNLGSIKNGKYSKKV